MVILLSALLLRLRLLRPLSLFLSLRLLGALRLPLLLRLLGALGVDATAYRAALDLLATRKYPFADLPRRVVGLDGVDALVRAMAGEAEAPPVHGVVTPSA